MINIKVAVRIRPFSKSLEYRNEIMETGNARDVHCQEIFGLIIEFMTPKRIQPELTQKDDFVIQKEDKYVLITYPKICRKQDGNSRKKTRRFIADFCYDPKDPEHSSQEVVYQEIGLEVLNSMFDGYNACVLAYGHSASGKTYTMMGTPSDPGLTPRICEGLFKRINLQSGIKFEIAVSFLEIYNEKVKDLLTEDEGRANSNNFPLRVREHPRLGPYVQDLSQHLVTDKSQLLEILDLGNKRRSTAATENNIHSSRSHTVFTLRFKQTDYKNYEINKSSKVHLVDLAGSERASHTQSKTRLKEGSNINKSLVALGNVISTLAENYEARTSSKEHSSLKTCQPFVPYRDSVLTWLLKDTLGGNSNTIMIATVSPASSCFNETVNTLRYAKRTKRIMNQHIINEDPKTRTIRELREEIIRLRSMLSTKKEKEFNKPDNLQRLLFGRKARSVEELPARRGKTTDHPTLRILEVGDAHRATYQAFGEKSTFSHMFLGTENAAPLKNDACKINDEKKSGANGLVIDNVHETEIFSDNLENSSLRVAKTVTTRKNNLEWTIPIFPSESNLKERKQRQVFEEKESKVCADSKNKHKVRLNRGPSSYENLTKINACKPLYKSRPDLIKGIITHSKDQIPSASYHSCTDISNLSKSNSENSLNSLGSLDTLLLENTGIQNTPRKKIRHLCQANHKKSPFYMNSKKKDSRSEIVEAVTTRLYVPKKKTDTSKELMQPAKIEECDEDNEFKGLKLCKRARMKLCALNRKLALAGSPKKTSDTITQTDFDQRTVRVKEKSVLTDQRGALEVESCGTCTCSAENLKERSKDPATFGQFTFPYNKSFVNCGKNDTLRAPQFSDKHNMQVSYAETMKGLANLPAEFVAKDEESFSEDSLDKEEPFQSDYINTNFYSEKHTNLKYMLPSNQDSTEPCDSLASLGYKKITTKDQNHSPVLEKNWNNIIHELDLKPKKKPQKEIQVKFFNGFASSLFPNTEDLSNLHDSIIRPLGLKKKDNLLSATKSAEAITSSETSSEDLLFYENSTKIGPANGTNEDGERILYTITENNEQTNPKDALNSLQNQKLIYNLLTENRGLQSSLESLSLNKDDKIRFEKNLPNYHHKENAGILEQYEALLKAKYLYFKETQFEGNTRNIVVKEKTKNSYLMNDLNSDNIEATSTKTETHTAENSEPGNFDTKNPLDAQVSSPTRLSACTNTKCTVEKVLDPCRTNNFMETSTKPIIRKPDSTEDNKSNITKAEFKCFEPKKINWADLPANNQKQFVNFNILNSPKKSQFSIDTHLFGEAMKKDQSTETMFGSKDSITFVFMGPAKPKTSVLMEVIKRSLNKGYSNEITFSHKKSRSTGVQCESKFLRSVSVDTAFIALSRIAQEPQQHISRTISLDNLTTDEMLLILEPEKPLSLKENSCQCDLDANCSKVPMKKLPLRYSVSTSTSQDQQTETVNLMSTSMNQTSLHHDGISIFETEENKVKALKNEIQQTLKDSFSSYINSSSQTRRVRFSKPETSKLAEDILQSINQKKESTHLNKSADAISIFLKEATILLRNLNYFNSFSHGSIESHEQRQDHLLRRKDLKAPLKKWSSQLKPPSFKEEADKRIPNFWANKSVVGRRKTETKNERVLQSLTWPRRQCAGRRAPERETEYGVNLKSLRSPKGPLSNSLNSNGSLDVTDKHSILGRQESNNTKLNTSNLSTARSNSCIQENQMRASSSRQNYSPEHELARDIFYYSSKPRHRIISVTDFSEIDSILDLETKLEESCYRLKLAAEQDQARQEVLEGKITEDVRDDHEQMSLHSLSSDYREGKCTTESRKSDSTMRLVKRRTSTECIRKCVCKDREKYFCTYPRSKNFRSTFELATFGPGSNHCNQFCTFCRRNESELYCSSPTLNSECSAGRCRLNYYGHCPCSSVKLRHVISSPRAYMQHLLTLRRHVINSRNISQT